MPSKSKSQQRLFGMVHAYQKGQLKHAPSKITEVASHISPTTAEHFAETKHKGLREHVKKAGWYENFRANINKVNGHYSPEEFKSMTGIDTKRAEQHSDEVEDKALIKKVVKPSALKKQAFDRGFIKAATDAGVEPLVAVKLLKQADGNITDWLYKHLSPNIPKMNENMGVADPGRISALEQQMATKGLTGAGMGGAAGAIGGGLAGYLGGRDKEHPENDHSMRNMMLMGLLGGGAGAIGGGLYNMQPSLNEYNKYITDHPYIHAPQSN